MLIRRLAFVLSFVAAPALAQDATPTIDPGMTREQVLERLGQPLNERSTGSHTYLFYRNGCEQTCGMNDLVVLDGGKVVDAVFRNGVRIYTGTSSSPSSVRSARSSRSSRSGNAASAAATVRKARRGGIVIGEPSDSDAVQRRPATVTGVQIETVPATAAQQGAPPTTPPSPLLGARVNPADSVRALTPGRPTPIPGTRLNSTDSARAEALRRQQADTTRKP